MDAHALSDCGQRPQVQRRLSIVCLADPVLPKCMSMLQMLLPSVGRTDMISHFYDRL